jgi:AraC family transcriptional regulator
MNLYIKNMVCPRCIKAVEQIFQGIGANVAYVKLGEVILHEQLTIKQIEELRSQLKQLGFELLDDHHKQQIDQMKSIVINRIHYRGDDKFNFSSILADTLHRDYSVLSKLFSETEGITIEQYIILQRTEKVKELLMYNEMNLNEISYELNYSSVAHLSAQFKKITGLTPTQFRKNGTHLRKFLNDV